MRLLTIAALLAILHGIACKVDLRCRNSDSGCELYNIDLNRNKEFGEIDTKNEIIKNIWFESCIMDSIPFDELLKRDEFKDVKEITVKESRVQEFHEERAPNLDQISLLRVQKNNITQLKKRAFYRFPKLENLIWNENNLVHLEVGTFDNLNQLTRLDFSNNKIEDLPDTLFQNLVSLKLVSFEKNKIQVLRENLFGSCNYINAVNFKENQISSIAVNMFTKCIFPKTATLDLTSNACFSQKLEKIYEEKSLLIDCFLEYDLIYISEITDKKLAEFYLKLKNIDSNFTDIRSGTKKIDGDYVVMASVLGGSALVLIVLVLILVICNHRKQTTRATADNRESITLQDCSDSDYSSSDSDSSSSDSSSDHRRKPKAIMHYK